MALAVRPFFSLGRFFCLDLFREINRRCVQIPPKQKNNNKSDGLHEEQLAYTYSDIFAKLFHSIYLVSSRRRRNLLLLEQLRSPAEVFFDVFCAKKWGCLNLW